MSKENQNEILGADLNEEVEVASPETAETKKTKKVDRETLVAGLEKLTEMGASENLLKLATLAVDWNEEAEVKDAAKTACLESFGGSDELRKYLESALAGDLAPYQGIAKLIPAINNINTFYARRSNTGKKKLKPVIIGGITYKVNEAYLDSLSNETPERRRELVLAHADTVGVEVEEL